MMPALPRIAAFAIAVSAVTPVASVAMEDYLRAASSASTAIRLCGEADGDRIKSADCRKAGYDKVVARIDKAFDAALAKTPANIRPLLKRDEAWFNEMILEAADTARDVDEDEIRANFAETLRRRVTALDGIAGGFGRPGFAGNWANAFGMIAVTPADGGAYRLAVDIRAEYGSDRHRSCRFSALVKPTATAWLAGPVLADKEKTEATAAPARPPTLKLRRQGETLRIVGFEGDEGWDGLTDCEYIWQITGSYFPVDKPDTADEADTAFVVPTFDCARPETATDEEICADPDLADNDNRLNRAWKALLPRLDEATRRALMDDQRGWVNSQAQQFPEFLHPGWDKTASETHYTTDARYHVDGLQRERIALLEGFDDKRVGLAGVWLAHNAIIRITIDGNGQLKGEGWKWDQGDWKAGCDYDITGKVAGGVFHSDEQRKNPDTLERDHAMLIVNRLDDVFARRRYKDNGADDAADEAKCKRRLDISSTARLFPAHPSPDINNLSGSIR